MLSDRVVVWIFRDPEQIATVSSLKGWLFVAVTSSLLYGQIQHYLRRIEHSLQQEAAARAQSTRAHELLAALIEGTEDAVFAKDLQGRYILANQAACQFVGRTRAQVLGHDDTALFPPEQAELLMKLDRRAVVERRVRTTEEVLTTPQGQRVFLATKGPLCDAQGAVIGSYGFSRDMTEQKNMLVRLRASEERLRLALEASDEGLWDWDLRADVAYRSPRYHALIERPPSALNQGFSLLRTFAHPEDLPRVEQAVQAVKSGAAPSLELEFRMLRTDGSIRWLRARGRVVERDAQGVALRMVGTLADIDRQKQAEEHLRLLNLQLESTVAARTQEWQDLYDQAPCGYHTLTPDGIIVQVNHTALEMLGYTREDFLGQPLAHFMSADSARVYRAHLEDLARSGRLRERELDFVCKNGQVLPILLNADLQRDAQGQAICIRSTVFDNSERKAQTRRILDLNKFLHGVLEVLPFGVVVLNQQGEVILRNQLFARLLDYPAELVERSPLVYSDLLHFNHRRGDYGQRPLEEVLARFATLLQERQPASFERQQASGVYLEVRGQPIASQWMLLAFADVSAHKAAEQSLLAARHVAEAATLAKSEFPANMSHEIRTPMNGILGLAYLLEKAELGPEARRLARKISHTGMTLQGILNDILDFSKIEAGQLSLEQASLRIGDVLESVATIMVNDPAHPDVELAIIPPAEPLPTLLGDPLRLGQVLVNLIGNAIKFTPQGQVRLAVTREPSEDGDVCLRFTVSDSGVGIPPAKLEEIFRAFSQADASTTRRFGGTGLGLAISRSLVERMGSRLEVRSQEGQGSTFWFTLRLPLAPQDPVETAAAHALALLIADDSTISREALRATALSLGWQAQVVDGGEAALRHALQDRTQGGEQVLLLDWKMPDLDGLSVARAVYQSTQGGQGPIVVLATAYSREELMAQPGIELADAVLTKPVTASSLLDAVELALHKRHGRPPPQAEERTQRLQGLRLLVVDDSEINREIATLIFTGEGASVVSVANGQEALDWLQAHAQAVDLVLMDVQMPVMDGLRATRLLRSNPALAALPVVALTAGAYQSDAREELAAGMNAHLSKPMDVEQAIALIRQLTGRPPLPALPASPAPVAIAQAAGAAAPALPGLQLQRGLQIWRDARIYQQYLRKFVRDYGSFATDLQALPPPARQACAHRLRGAAGNLALDQVATAAATLDERLRRGQDADDSLLDLQQAIAQACIDIRRYAGSERAAPADDAAPASPDDIAALLQQALCMLGSDSPEGMEQLLQRLRASLPAAEWEALSHAVERFDFRAAEAVVHRLAATLPLQQDYAP